MCYYISLAVDQAFESAVKQKLRSSFRLNHSENPYIRSWLSPHDVLFVLSSGMCACDLFSPRQPTSENLEEQLRRKYAKPKYKKMGWTQAKIDRAIADRLSKPTVEFFGLRSDLRWQLSDLATDVGRLSVIVHFYSGDTENEEVPIRSKKSLSSHELRDNDESVSEDELVEVTG